MKNEAILSILLTLVAFCLWHYQGSKFHFIDFILWILEDFRIVFRNLKKFFECSLIFFKNMFKYIYLFVVVFILKKVTYL